MSIVTADMIATCLQAVMGENILIRPHHEEGWGKFGIGCEILEHSQVQTVDAFVRSIEVTLATENAHEVSEIFVEEENNTLFMSFYCPAPTASVCVQ